MVSAKHVIELNNGSVALMRNQQFQKAVAVASSALKHHRELRRISEQEYTTECGFIDSCMFQDDATDDEPSNDSTEEFVYQKGIRIPSNVSATFDITPILLFNLALSHQLLAQQQPQDSRRFLLLEKAKRLYELVGKSFDTRDNTLFEFAIINNAAVIHKTLGDDATSKKYFELLLSHLMMFVDCESSNRLRPMYGFLANMTSETQSAAAA